LRFWFNELLEEVDPKVFWMNYAFWDGIIDHQSSANLFKVIDIQDLVSLNKKMSLAAYYDLQRYLSNRRGDDNGVLCEDYYQRLELSVSTEEYAIYDQYDITLAINPAEAVLLRLNTQKTRVVHLPMNYPVPAMENKYSGPAIFPMGPNTFNIQGYYYFIRKVLPLVREVIPDFCLQVTGPGSVGLPPEEGVQHSGVLPDLLDSYREARMAVCPVFGGTGQKIKIIEALAYGVPVVALRASALGSPLVHGDNGFIVENSKTFAEYIITLWKNPGLCRILGANGREKIADGASHKNLLQNLSSLWSYDNQNKAERSDR
jgi:glycosyltransferase involved in cell wall biosynthesis